ncbi:hypothetical protein EB796_015512 [Bugula neritina]|uniref:Uncharacterized protein n=1 Tax=Bugula neritina TaxID=10212 RepID=A0A7J7JIN4_BUGNE|nr:hypothetical protein EB796_015512 [Bugula neritina]
MLSQWFFHVIPLLTLVEVFDCSFVGSEEGPQSSRFNSEQAKSRINTSALTTGPTQSSTQIHSNFGKTSGTGCTQRLCVDEDLRPVSENCEGQSRHSTKPCGNHETEVGVVYESMGGDFAAVGGVYGAVGGVYGAVGGVYGAVGGDLKAVGGDSIIVARDGEAQSLANLPPEGVATSPSCSQSQISGSHDLSMSTFDSNFSRREYNF